MIIGLEYMGTQTHYLKARSCLTMSSADGFGIASCNVLMSNQARRLPFASVHTLSPYSWQ